MKKWIRIGITLAALGTFTAGWAGTSPVAAPVPRDVAPGVWLVAGGFPPDRQPDGNSVIFGAPAGLVVVDTGRHSWQREAILALVRAQKKEIVAIVNTHWHLDHVSGNPELRAAYPGLRVYASDAIDAALTGFFPSSVKESAAYLDDPQVPQATRDDIRGDLLRIQNGAALRPDEVISFAGTMTLGGLPLWINLARDAATASDVWLYDEKTRVAVLGDLVTLPAPFLDTACPEGWKVALQQVAGTPFEIAIPGHGAPLTRAQFQVYQTAFNAFIACASSARPQGECASGWADSIRTLLADDPAEQQRARGMAAYYVEMLRANGGRSKFCKSTGRP
jgi:glyoxylase-like metal-dependent hydrolase (beta-lactamase superfamily II)